MSLSHLKARRRWATGFGLSIFSPLAVLSACSPSSKASFHSIDITGANYGRDFALRDPEGRVRRLPDFKGRLLLIFFGFTQCPDVCPTSLARAVEVMQLLGPQAGQLQVAFVTVDPERDTPALLAEYTRAFHPSFLGLHADLETTAATAREFKVFYKKVPTGSSYTMDHTAMSYAFDREGRLRLAVRHEQTAAQVAADLKALL
jgi:protein SCO1/2